MFIFNSRFKLLLSVIFILATTQVFGADGDLDLTFGGSGKIITDVDSGSDTVRDLVVQTDGKIIAVGYSIVSASSRRGAVVRYRPNGSVDPTFGTNGRVLTPLGQLEAVALQPDGKIVVAGYSGSTGAFDFYIARLNTDGTFDTTFNSTGSLSLDMSTVTDFGNSVVIQPDGKILVGGGAAIAFGIARLNADGSLDTSFDGDGKAFTTIQESASINHLALQPDGKILAVGLSRATNMSSGNPVGSFATARYNTNGSPDTSFNGTGFATTRFIDTNTTSNAINNVAETVLLRPGGKILVVGTTGIAGESQVAMIQYNTDGSPDSGFGTGGKKQISLGSFTILTADDAALQADNKIVFAGVSGNIKVSRMTVGRLNADGTLDTTFSDDGLSQIQLPTNVFSRAFATAIQPDGKILGGGYVGGGVPQDFLLARFNSNCTTTCAGGRYEIADFDGDGRSDLSVFRSGTWFINPSTANDPTAYYSQQLGAAGDRLVPEDYDGDQKTDLAVWREDLSTNQSYFYIWQSATSTLRTYQFGNTGDDPGAVGDWDGDGIADLAVYRPGAQSSLFYYIPSSAPTGYAVIPWGLTGDKVVRGDFDGDNRQDAAVYRPSNGVWYVLQSSNLQPFYLQWGIETDKLTPADFDGDGRTDPAVYRDGTWYVWQSSNQQPRYAYWGIAGDQVVAGDYDGDGRVDFAVRRGGVYYILANSTSQPSYYYFGFADDIPAASAFVR